MVARPLVRAIASLALVGCGLPVLAEESSQQTALSPKAAHLPEAFTTRLALDQRLQDLGWKLAAGNGPFCQHAPPAIGLQLHDMASYRNPAAVRRALRVGSELAVLTVAAGSPAEHAGLSTNQPVIAINGTRIGEWSAKPHSDWRRIERVHDTIAASLAEKGEVALTLADEETVTLSGARACATRFELSRKPDAALADGLRVRFGAEFPGFAYSDDELAAAIAHELAHNVLAHRVWLDAAGRSFRNVRLTEREADRLAPWLLANAGFPPEAALRFMLRWGPEHGSGIFRKRTHEGWDERAEHIAAEIPLVLEALEQDGHADWRARFRREIDPAP